MNSPYEGQPERTLTADAIHLDAVRAQFEAFKAAIVKMRERVIHSHTEKQLDDLIDALIDLDHDFIDPTISQLESALNEYEAAREREHVRIEGMQSRFIAAE